MQNQWNHKVFNVNDENFEALALEVFNFQYGNNPVYQAYVKALKVNPDSVGSLTQIPFLPIRFFKSHIIKTTLFEPLAVFESSGTTGSVNSRHFIKDISLYEESFLRSFELFYGNIEDYAIFALLPSYLERKGSSLVYMVDRLIKLSKNEHSQFGLNDVDKMISLINLREQFPGNPENLGKKNILIGVTYALLDMVEKQSVQLKHTIFMETGGMKGRRKEMIRQEVHEKLCNRLGVDHIHSEYGMTELLSQAYSKGEGIFHCPPWMKIMMRDDEDPLFVQPGFTNHEAGAKSSKSENELLTPGSGLSALSGAINVIDLANIYSCSFIATDDAGKLNRNGSFEVLGRMDGSDLRGCGLMVV